MPKTNFLYQFGKAIAHTLPTEKLEGIVHAASNSLTDWSICLNFLFNAPLRYDSAEFDRDMVNGMREVYEEGLKLNRRNMGY